MVLRAVLEWYGNVLRAGYLVTNGLLQEFRLKDHVSKKNDAVKEIGYAYYVDCGCLYASH